MSFQKDMEITNKGMHENKLFLFFEQILEKIKDILSGKGDSLL